MKKAAKKPSSAVTLEGLRASFDKLHALMHTRLNELDEQLKGMAKGMERMDWDHRRQCDALESIARTLSQVIRGAPQVVMKKERFEWPEFSEKVRKLARDAAVEAATATPAQRLRLPKKMAGKRCFSCGTFVDDGDWCHGCKHWVCAQCVQDYDHSGMGVHGKMAGVKGS